MNESKLWVDDLRHPPNATWAWARSSDEAIIALETADWDLMSLDHDLGGDDTSRRIVLWLCEYPTSRWPTTIRVHSANPVGAKWLRDMTARYAEEGTLQW